MAGTLLVLLPLLSMPPVLPIPFVIISRRVS